ncbi:CHAT domain-containing protein [Haloarcula nitratireducens]|uniref:CHAT domain-containing protein n=1 Tax=Haloarcula nitratireducens TaxID=2487749 RepID=A0AAW4P8I7_9EURY|nr:CHAT domain-containing protein [Halomicroarcula nitratireducens]MBX0294366.1 CHAT domain-containing protein [Halomicroarcula nitratireducens]
MVFRGTPDARSGGDSLATDDDGGPLCPEAILEQLDSVQRPAAWPIPRQTDESFTAETGRLVLPGTDVTVSGLECNAQYQLSRAAELPEGTFLVTGTVERATCERDDPFATDEVRVHVRFDGPASLRPTCEGTVLSLWESGPITLGFSETTTGLERVQVPETVAGLADGLSCLSVAHHTMAPSRSHPAQRDHPPLLTTGETASIPDAVARQRRETGIELRLPETVESVFVAAPLAFYLGASVTVGDRDRPLLTAAGTDVHREFSPLPGFQTEAAAMLRRVFYLDCLIRRVNPGRNADLLDACSLDPDAVRALSPAGRLERYLSVPSAAIRDGLPEWHLSTHARPSLDRARCLPFLLDKLSLVYLPEAAELDRRDLLDQTLADAYPTRGTPATATRVEPSAGSARVRAWLAPGTPVDAFKPTTAAYENRYRYRERDGDRLRVSVVLNDSTMSDERGAVTDIYRAADLPMDVTVTERLTRAELADVFESRNDFVHFIGHCEDGGLRCPDGTLSAETLSNVRTRTFFLNACGSYDEGLALVESGAVAGAVTFTDVLDRHAARVGTAFARLLSNGFSIHRALALARRRIVMGKDYAVVGDGTYALMPGPADPVVVWLTETDAGYDVVCEVVTPRAGERYRLPFGSVNALNGRRTALSVDAETLVETLESASVPVIFDGDFHWSPNLAARLAEPA